MTFPVLQDKVAIITGAAMGMGAATAQLFAEAGAKVVVADFNEDKGRQVVADIEAAGGVAFFQRVDISNSEQVKAMVDATVEQYGRLTRPSTTLRSHRTTSRWPSSTRTTGTD